MNKELRASVEILGGGGGLKTRRPLRSLIKLYGVIRLGYDGLIYLVFNIINLDSTVYNCLCIGSRLEG
jgi:hypothetical protein